MVTKETAIEVEKINYRSVGRGSGGVVKKRRPVFVRDYDQPTPSAIPSKYLTVLYQNNHEKRGFGNHATRFQEQRPVGSGPLAPTADPAPVGTVGKRGVSAFASRTPRWVNSARGSQPGPGAYETVPVETPGSPSAQSAAFVIPGSVNPAKYVERPAPGPGEYIGTSDQALTYRGPAHEISAFISHTGKNEGGRLDMPLAGKDTPGPGHYEGPGTSLRSPSQLRGGAKSPRRRLLVEAPTDPMAGLTMQEQLKKGEKLLASEAPERDRKPGPGDYDTNIDVIRGRQDFNRLGFSAFQVGNSEQPRKWTPQIPGPGFYNPDPSVEIGRAGSGSPAPRRSFKERFERQVPLAPGPAYYTPRVVAPAQSFHLNVQKTWV